MKQLPSFLTPLPPPPQPNCTFPNSFPHSTPRPSPVAEACELLGIPWDGEETVFDIPGMALLAELRYLQARLYAGGEVRRCISGDVVSANHGEILIAVSQTHELRKGPSRVEPSGKAADAVRPICDARRSTPEGEREALISILVQRRRATPEIAPKTFEVY